MVNYIILQSVQYHENGKKHQLNVEAKLNEVSFNKKYLGLRLRVHSKLARAFVSASCTFMINR